MPIKRTDDMIRKFPLIRRMESTLKPILDNSDYDLKKGKATVPVTGPLDQTMKVAEPKRGPQDQGQMSRDEMKKEN